MNVSFIDVFIPKSENSLLGRNDERITLPLLSKEMYPLSNSLSKFGVSNNPLNTSSLC